MELFILFSVLLCVRVYYIIRVFMNNRHHDDRHHELPPGSTGWPIIGESLEFLKTARKGVPEKFIEDRRRKYSSAESNNCKVFKTSLLLESMAVLCTAGGNKFLFSNENKLVKSWWPANVEKIFANSDKTSTSAESSRLRRVLSPHLKPDALQKYIRIMDVVTKKHLDTYWDEKDEVKVHSLAQKYTFILACRIFLNIEDPQLVAKIEEPIQHVASGFVSLPINLPGTQFNRAIRASQQIRKDIEIMLIEQRKRTSENPNNDDAHEVDLVSSLLMETYSDGQLMKESDIANKLYGLIVGAQDNIVGALDSIIMYLSDYPQVYDAVLKEQMEIADSKAAGELLNWGDVQKMKYSWSVACEVLRLLPPNVGTFREAITDFVYEGYLIPKGMKLHWNAPGTHKNPEYFPNPEQFDPSRFAGQALTPFSYVPFGGGPRMCPGKEYARFKILVFMHNVVTRFKWEKVFPDEKMIMDPILVPTKGLPVRLYPHVPNSATLDTSNELQD